MPDVTATEDKSLSKKKKQHTQHDAHSMLQPICPTLTQCEMNYA